MGIPVEKWELGRKNDQFLARSIFILIYAKLAQGKYLNVLWIETICGFVMETSALNPQTASLTPATLLPLTPHPVLQLSRTFQPKQGENKVQLAGI